MQKKRPEELLNKCIEDILAGKDVEDCLQAYPCEEADALRPLLAASRDVVEGIGHIEPPPSLKARVRLQMVAALESRRQMPQKAPRFAWAGRFATAAVAFFLVVVLSSATVVLSLDAQPDSLLYGVKLGTEQTRLALTTSHEDRADLRAQFAANRVDEIVYLASTGDLNRIEGVVQTLESNLAVSPPAAMRSATEPEFVEPEPIKPEPPGIMVLTEPDDAVDPVPEISPSVARRLAVLESALQFARDEATRAALQEAIERTRHAYETALTAGTIRL